MSADDDDLICSITHELFRDPVLAEDGHVYEREAITRWINEHGTSPLTRQPLRVDRLQPDDEVRRRADQRRRLPVTYNRQSNQVNPPPTTDTVVMFVSVRDLPGPTTRHTCCQNVRCRCPTTDILGDRCCESTCSSCCSRYSCGSLTEPHFILFICVMFSMLIPLIIVLILIGIKHRA